MKVKIEAVLEKDPCWIAWDNEANEWIMSPDKGTDESIHAAYHFTLPEIQAINEKGVHKIENVMLAPEFIVWPTLNKVDFEEPIEFTDGASAIYLKHWDTGDKDFPYGVLFEERLFMHANEFGFTNDDPRKIVQNKSVLSDGVYFCTVKRQSLLDDSLVFRAFDCEDDARGNLREGEVVVLAKVEMIKELPA